MEDENKILLATPVHDSTSSVFMTPPLSDKPNKTADMVSQKLPRIQNLILLTPQSPEKTEDDIVTSFYLQGYPLILEKIFSYLSQADVTSCAAVCTRWRLFCTNLKSIASSFPEKEKPPLKQRQRENQFLKRSKKQSDRGLPLSNRNFNIMSPPEVTPPSIPEIKRTKCPNCSSPAKQYNLVHAECCSCTHTFCPRCLGKAHTNNRSCGSRSPPIKRDFAELTIGTKQSKKRLKRL